MMPVPYSYLLQLAMPQAIVVLTVLAVLTVDLTAMRERSLRARSSVAAVVGALGCMVAVVRIVLVPMRANVLDGMLVVTPLVCFVQTALLVLTIVALLLVAESEFTGHVGEFVALMLMATTGMLFLVSTQNLLVLFIALEILSLSLYAMTAFDKRNPLGAEAALKYFLFGGMSAAFLLYGFSLLYGMTNSLALPRIGAALAGVAITPLLIVAMVAVAVGLGFKVAAAPFHFWTPDVYQSSPMPSAAFVASASKVASFYVFFVLLTTAFASATGSARWGHAFAGWAALVAALAALSMLIGNLGALVQTSVRRLVAYSAVANAGYMLIALTAHSTQSLHALLYYVLTYSVATLGTFAVVGAVEEQTGSDSLVSFDGLSRRSPVLAACLFVFLLSQAGIPPLAGFFGKFFLFAAALRAEPGLLWLVALAIATSAVSLFYYLQVLKRAYARDVPENAVALHVSTLRMLVSVGLAAATLVLGCVPQLLLRWIP